MRKDKTHDYRWLTEVVAEYGKARSQRFSTPDTRKAGRFLLLFSTLLILFAIEVISLEGMDMGGAKIRIQHPDLAVLLFGIPCFYLVIQYFLDVRHDIEQWRYGNSVARQKLKDNIEVLSRDYEKHTVKFEKLAAVLDNSTKLEQVQGRIAYIRKVDEILTSQMREYDKRNGLKYKLQILFEGIVPILMGSTAFVLAICYYLAVLSL